MAWFSEGEAVRSAVSSCEGMVEYGDGGQRRSRALTGYDP
jgi:hypothetical protein